MRKSLIYVSAAVLAHRHYTWLDTNAVAKAAYKNIYIALPWDSSLND